jgi:hypothetical protein
MGLALRIPGQLDGGTSNHGTSRAPVRVALAVSLSVPPVHASVGRAVAVGNVLCLIF